MGGTQRRSRAGVGPWSGGDTRHAVAAEKNTAAVEEPSAPVVELQGYRYTCGGCRHTAAIEEWCELSGCIRAACKRASYTAGVL